MLHKSSSVRMYIKGPQFFFLCVCVCVVTHFCVHQMILSKLLSLNWHKDNFLVEVGPFSL